MAVSFTLSRAGLEVYTTKDDPKLTFQDSSETNYKLKNGEVTQIDYIGELFSDNFEQDYSDISSNATIVMPISYYKIVHKGKKVALKKGVDVKKWDDMGTAITGFINEITLSRDQMEIKINGMDKLLEQEKKFTFKKTKMSKIIKKIIESSGLKAKIDVTGLKDHVIDFTNVSSSGDKESSSGSSSGLAGGEGKTIDDLVKKIVGSETNELKKCELVHQWLKENVQYSSYECSNYGSAEECLNNCGHLNCADTARLTRAMMSSAGLDAWVVHRSSNNGHFWTLIKIDGKIYASDQTGSGSDFNTIWYSQGDRRGCDDRGGNWDVENGKEPDC